MELKLHRSENVSRSIKDDALELHRSEIILGYEKIIIEPKVKVIATQRTMP